MHQLLRARAAGRRRVVLLRVSVQVGGAPEPPTVACEGGRATTRGARVCAARPRANLGVGGEVIANRFIANANQFDRSWISRPQRPEASVPGTLPRLRREALIPPSSSLRSTSSEGSLG